MTRRAPLLLAIAGVLQLALPWTAPGVFLAPSLAAAAKESRPAPPIRVLPYDLRWTNEDALLPNHARAILYALGNTPEDLDPLRSPVVLVHGMQGDPRDLQPVVDHLSRSLRQRDRETSYQLYILAYADYQACASENGQAFAEELQRLATSLAWRHRLTIVAHSLGGIVARDALNILAAHSLPEEFSSVLLVAIDSPWHGYRGPADRGLGKLLMRVARPFLAPGLEELRAESALFLGDDREGHSPRGLLRTLLPSQIEIKLVFAQEGAEVMDYTEGVLQQLVPLLLRHYRDDQAVSAEPRVMNFYHALVSAQPYFALQDELRRLADAGLLNVTAVRHALLRHYPRFPGNHMTVLDEHVGQYSLLDYLAAELDEAR